MDSVGKRIVGFSCLPSPPLSLSSPTPSPQPTLLRTLEEAQRVRESASAFWRAPVQSVNVDPELIRDLPFVNRVPNLEAALKALLHNQRGSWKASGDRRYQLLFCAQLFGVGKTAFGKKLAEGLSAGVGGRLAYHR